MKVTVIILLVYPCVLNCQDYFTSEKYGKDMVATVTETEDSRSDFPFPTCPRDSVVVARGRWVRERRSGQSS